MRAYRCLHLSGAACSFILSCVVTFALATSAQARSVSGQLMADAVAAELSALAPDAIYGAFVHFDQGSMAEQNAVLADHQLVIVKDFRKYATSAFVQGPAASFLAVGQHPWVTYIEHNTPQRYLGETQSWASRLRVAQEPVAGGPFYADAAKTQLLDGTGVTLGIIDSGVLGSHPDFGNLLYNFKLVNPTTITRIAGDPVTSEVPGYVEVGLADSESQVGGHGTHVTGTVGGTGAASNGFADGSLQPNIPGTYAGAAPGAQLIHWGNGAGLLVLDVNAAYVDLLERLDDIENNPGFENLVAVNNSYGSDPAPYNPDATASQLTNEILSRGIVMAFAASNDGGDGSEARTSPACRNPTPGLICVANYNDQGTGSRDGGLASSSSRGLKTDESTESFPDISAPGSNITSTCLQGLPSQAVCSTGAETDWQPWYGTISGTSMATPHIVGIIGVLQQAHKGIHGRFMTPPEVEELLQRTARRVGDLSEYVEDPQLQGRDAYAGVGQTTTHFGFGAGLVDVPAALAAIGGIPRGGDPVVGEPVVVFDQDDDFGDSADVIKLTIADATLNDENGQLHQLTLADAAGFFAGTVYTIERNVAGVPYKTSVVTDGDGNFRTAENGANNTAMAGLVERNGAVVSVFVPNSAVNRPAPGEPVHNIRVVVTNGVETYDYAPSPADSLYAEADVARSMFGRAATIGLPSSPVPVVSMCDAVGPQIASDKPGDVSAEGLTPDNVPPFSQQDLRYLHIAHPYVENGAQQLVIRVGLTSTSNFVPGSAYFASFSTPDGMRGVRMQVVDPTAPEFFWYVPGANSAGGVDGRFVDAQTPITGEVDTDNNELRFFVEPSVFGIDVSSGDPALAEISQFNAGVTQSTDPAALGLPRATFVTDGMPDGLGRVGKVTILSNDACAPGSGNTAPVAQDVAVSTAFETAVDITLPASDADGDNLSFSIVDGPSHGTLGAVSGNTVTYTPASGYSGADSFTFRASDGTEASNLATVSLTVESGEQPNNGTLSPVLVVQTTSGSLTATLDASQSAYESGDAIHEPEYRFIFGDDQDNDGQIDSTPFQGSAQVTRTYEAAGTYTATLIIRDGHGQSDSTSETFELQYTIEVTGNQRGNHARFTISDAAGPAPHRVEFDASPTVTADGWQVIAYRWDFDGDGNVDSEGATRKTVSHVYTRAGNYTPTLTVEFSDGQNVESKSVTSRVTTTGERRETPAPDTSSNPGTTGASSGGSGSLGWLILPGLFLATVMRRRRKA